MVARVLARYGKIAFPLAATHSRAAFGGYARIPLPSDPGNFLAIRVRLSSVSRLQPVLVALSGILSVLGTGICTENG